MQKKFRRLAAVMLCLTLLVVPALAAEATIDLDYVTIVGEGFAADTFCGVDALYNETGATPFCNELIERFYSAVYGVTVFTNSGDITAASPAATGSRLHTRRSPAISPMPPPRRGSATATTMPSSNPSTKRAAPSRCSSRTGSGTARPV